METAMLSPADAMLLGQNNGFGNNGSWIWVLLLAFLWGGNGNGFGWGNRGGYGMTADFIDGSATRAAVNSGFQYNQLDSGIRGIQNGLCDGFYAINSGIKDAAYGITGAVKDCCCTTQRTIDGVRYDMSRGFCDVITANNLNTRDILEAQNASTQKILDYLNDSEKQALRERISTLETSGIVQAQTKNLIETLRPCPIPSYVVCNPYTGSYPTYAAGFGSGYGVGYGCGCGI